MPIPTESIKISQLPAVVTPQPTDELPANNSGTTRKMNPSQLSADYKALSVLPTAVYNGNRNYTLTFPNIDLTATLSAGMRLRTTATVTPPTQCADLESSSNNYFSKISPGGMTATDDFATGGWIKLESYAAAGNVTGIAARTNTTNGWTLWLSDTGAVIFNGRNGAAGNFSRVTSYRTIPLAKWVYIAAQLDMSAFTATTTTSYIMIDGVDVPATVARSGTNPTALVAAGDFELGRIDSTNTYCFDGKIAQFWVSSAKVTQANVRTFASQGLTPALIAANNIVSAYSLNNSINDLNTTTANNLTAQNSAAATNADSFCGGQANKTIANIDYSIIQTVALAGSDTVLNVQVAEGCTIPTSGGVASVSYATVKSPFGFPVQRDKWRLQAAFRNDAAQGSPTVNVWYNFGGLQFTIPIGEWRTGYRATTGADRGGAGRTDSSITLSTANNSESDMRLSGAQATGNAGIFSAGAVSVEDDVSLSSATIYYLNARVGNTSMNTIYIFGSAAWVGSFIYADNAYL